MSQMGARRRDGGEVNGEVRRGSAPDESAPAGHRHTQSGTAREGASTAAAGAATGGHGGNSDEGDLRASCQQSEARGAGSSSGWRPTQHNNSGALWDQIAYGDTDVPGAVAHAYRGADDRIGATSMRAGYGGGHGDALRASKNNDVLDHGAYQPRVVRLGPPLVAPIPHSIPTYVV